MNFIQVSIFLHDSFSKANKLEIIECILFPNYNVIFLIKINVLWLKTIMRFAKEPEMKVENKMWDMIYL